jgi:ribosomal protein L34
VLISSGCLTFGFSDEKNGLRFGSQKNSTAVAKPAHSHFHLNLIPRNNRFRIPTKLHPQCFSSVPSSRAAGCAWPYSLGKLFFSCLPSWSIPNSRVNRGLVTMANPFRPAVPVPSSGTSQLYKIDRVQPQLTSSILPTLDLNQVRFAPRNTYKDPTWRVRKRRHGFLAKIGSRTGRIVIKRRKAKGRKNLSC